jgi:hypothetical protein
VSAEALYDLNHRWELGGKVALKLGELRTRRETGAWIENGLTLGTVRARYHFVRNWDALAEYRRLASVGGEDVRHGALFAVYRHLLDQLKVGVGYSFTDFNDDLKDEQYTHRGWFFDIVWKQ